MSDDIKKGRDIWFKRHPVWTAIFAIIIIWWIVTLPKPAATPNPTTSESSENQQAETKSYQEIFSASGKGDSNTESFSTSGGKLKMVATTTGGHVGTYTGIHLNGDSGKRLSNADLSISTDGAEDGQGQTIIRGAGPGTYYISVISGVNWDVHVYEEK